MEELSESGLVIIKGQAVSLPTSGLSPLTRPLKDLSMLPALSAASLLASLFSLYMNKNAKMAIILFVGSLFLLSLSGIEGEAELLDRCHSGDQVACSDLQHKSDLRLKRVHNEM